MASKQSRSEAIETPDPGNAPEGATLAEVFAKEELPRLQAKVDTAVTFLRWLANYTRSDWNLRQRVVRCLREMDAWDQ